MAWSLRMWARGGPEGSCARRWRADFLGICNRGFLAFLPLEVIFRSGFVFALLLPYRLLENGTIAEIDAA